MIAFDLHQKLLLLKLKCLHISLQKFLPEKGTSAKYGIRMSYDKSEFVQSPKKLLN